jgi:putative transposase
VIPPSAPKTGTYFVSTGTHERRRVFQVERQAQLLMETLQHYRAEGKYKLHAFVVMPDHVHLLITPLDISVERAVGLVKGGFSHRLGSKMPVWQKGFDDRRCRDADDFLTRKTYIHMNPVRVGLVAEMHLYPYSSAYRREVGRSG